MYWGSCGVWNVMGILWVWNVMGTLWVWTVVGVLWVWHVLGRLRYRFSSATASCASPISSSANALHQVSSTQETPGYSKQSLDRNLKEISI